MSKMAAIETAVRLQLVADGKTVTYDQRFDGAAPGYNYDAAGMTTFLLNVANRLKLDKPSLDFAWRKLTAAECLSITLPLLVSLIENATSDPKYN